MKTGIEEKKLPISKIMVQGTCPVCAAIKHFQESFLERLQARQGAGLCNVHAWSVARSAPAELAASLLLHVLKSKDWSVNSTPSCIACKNIHAEELSRLKEVTQELKGGSHGPWIKLHAKFCIRHLTELKQWLPLDLQKSIEENALRTASELEKELEEFLQQAKQGNHAGGGVLGRTAEFLVARRGILD
jgi:hypothetical protein